MVGYITESVGSYMAIFEENLSVLYIGVSVPQVCRSRPEAFYLGADERHAHLDDFLYIVPYAGDFVASYDLFAGTRLNTRLGFLSAQNYRTSPRRVKPRTYAVNRYHQIATRP